MAQAMAYSKTGAKQDKKVTLPATVFGVDADHNLVGQAYRTYLANGRSAHASVLNRGDVRGGGKKPWRQKGTGRARVGSSRVPNWRGGGSVFGPTGLENYKLNLPVKMKRLAIRQALSLQAGENKISVVESFESEGRVKPTIALLGKLGLEGKIVLVVPEKTDIIDRATRNVAGLEVVSAKYLNVFTIMNADHLIMTQPALKIVEDWLTSVRVANAKTETAK
jgi:large subunit ribosomal protein L4